MHEEHATAERHHNLFSWSRFTSFKNPKAVSAGFDASTQAVTKTKRRTTERTLRRGLSGVRRQEQSTPTADDQPHVNDSLPRRWRRSGSGKLRPPSSRTAGKSFDEQTVTRSASTNSWNEYGTTLAPPTPIEPPPPVWTLNLPEAVTTTPSLMTLMHEELHLRGVAMPRQTFESVPPRPSAIGTNQLPKRSISIKSALSNFTPHPGVRPLFHEGDNGLQTEQQRCKTATTDYPKGIPLALIVLGICLSVFIISLDRGIITTAIPAIVAEFRSTSDIGWYGSAYLLTASAFQPLYGRIYTSFDIKWSFLMAVSIFEVGSLVCAISPTSKILILGRAMQGLGSAGVLTGSFVVGIHSVSLAHRPILFAFVGVLYGTGALCGPMLGGTFSQLVSWRWCFYLNLPIGAVTFISVLLFFQPKHLQSSCLLGKESSNLSTITNTFYRRLKALDWIGNSLFTAACTFLFLALQWSQERSSDWSSARCIAAISLSSVTFLAFVLWLRWRGNEALIPLHILSQRTVSVSCASAFFIYGALLIHPYYLPIWFQAIVGKSAFDSGICMVPYMLTNAFFSLAAGIFVSKEGLFAPPAIIGCAIGTVGAGLLATLQVNANSSVWAGFEVLVSAGLGMAIQQGFSAVQATLPLHEVPIGTAAVVACQSAGGAIFVSVGNTLLQTHLFDENSANTIPGVNIRAVIELGAAKFRDQVPVEQLPALLELYNNALQAVFVAAVPLCGMAFVCTLFMEWTSVRVDVQDGRPAIRHDVETGSTSAGFSTPTLRSDASTLAHLAPRARARWSQK